MKIIEIKEDVKIKQGDRDIILEKGDRVQVLKEQPILPIDLLPIDFSDLIKIFNRMGIPVRNIDANVSRGVIFASGGEFIGKPLGIFASGLRGAELKTFISNVGRDNQNRLVWRASWDLQYTLIGGGTNGIEVLNTWYYFDEKKWVEKPTGR